MKNMASKKKERVVLVDEIASTKWLHLKTATWIDKDGKEKKWDFVERTRKTPVVTMAIKAPDRRYVVISQFRPPVASIVYEFPAGLMDAGESPFKAAAREVKEETGYEITQANVLSTSRLNPKSAGLTNEAAYFIECKIGKVDKQDLKDSENIKVYLMTPEDVIDLGMSKKRVFISNDLWVYMVAKCKRKTCGTQE